MTEQPTLDAHDHAHDDDADVRITGDHDDLDRLERLHRLLRGEQSASQPHEQPSIGLACVADLADTLDTLARAFREGIIDPKTTLSHYAQGRADGLAWAAEQLRTVLGAGLAEPRRNP